MIWDVERCVMWNEAECGPRHVVVEVVSMRDVRGKWWDVECGGVLMCDVDRYAKHGSEMWNWV